MGIETMITMKVAESAGRSIAQRVIPALQNLKGEHLQSGDDSGLKNVWEEICVQVQSGDYSYFLEAYEMTIDSFIRGHIEKLEEHVTLALWLQTYEGETWSCDAGSQGIDSDEVPWLMEDVVAYIRNYHVLPAAGGWSNKRISRYLER